DTPLVPNASSALVDLNFDPPFPSGPAFHAAKLVMDATFIARFRPRVLSTSLALAWVAAGRRAAYLSDCLPQGNVHYAAAISVCESAGCTISDFRGQPVRARGVGLVAAADAETHKALLGMVRKHLG
ncbi:MAG: phosphatase, partial [Chloroflexi bacterium]|nr:phosphatase [Chloroflexota bacterium]